MYTPDHSRIADLWQRFSAYTATLAEVDELLQLLASDEFDEESRGELQRLLADTKPVEVDRERWAPVLQNILGPAGETPATTPARPMRTPIRRIVLAAMSIAAVLLLFLGIRHLWWISRPVPMVSATPAADVTAGGNKAVLTLSGGQKIILDSAASGALAMEGPTTIQKLAGGRLAYQAGKEKKGSVLFNTLTTPKGGQYQLTLPDGSKVWLNAASSITYPTAFEEEERTVSLTGEAYFEVVKDAYHPFRVKAAGQTVEDIGTHFNINVYGDEPAMVTTLLEGAVRIGIHILKPGERAIVGKTGTIAVTKGDPEQAVAWKNGLFYFSDADLRTVMRQLARWYNIDVRYEGNIPEIQFNGMIGRSLSLNQVLKGLTKQGIHYRIENSNQLIINP